MGDFSLCHSGLIGRAAPGPVPSPGLVPALTLQEGLRLRGSCLPRDPSGKAHVRQAMPSPCHASTVITGQQITGGLTDNVQALMAKSRRQSHALPMESTSAIPSIIKHLFYHNRETSIAPQTLAQLLRSSLSIPVYIQTFFFLSSSAKCPAYGTRHRHQCERTRTGSTG